MAPPPLVLDWHVRPIGHEGHVRNEMADKPYVRVKTLPQLAEELGINRSTMVRLEQRGIIPMAPKVRTPIQGRVYDEALEKEVIKAYHAYMQGNRDNGARPMAPNGTIVVAR